MEYDDKDAFDLDGDDKIGENQVGLDEFEEGKVEIVKNFNQYLNCSKLHVSLERNVETGLHKLNIDKCSNMPMFSDAGSKPDG